MPRTLPSQVQREAQRFVAFCFSLKQLLQIDGGYALRFPNA